MTKDDAGFLPKLLGLLAARKIRHCVIGGQAVNAYVEPVVSLDLVVAAEQLDEVDDVFAEFRIKRFPHSINLELDGSDQRVQIQTDPRYAEFVDRAAVRTVLGHELPVAAVEDVLQGKVWAASDPARRASKRQKDLADIARLLEAHPDLRDRVPADVLARLV